METRRSLLEKAKGVLLKQAPSGEIYFFVTTCSEDKRGKVWQTTGKDFERAWVKVERYLKKFIVFPKWLKIELADTWQEVTAEEGKEAFQKTQRNNYFRYGVKFKKDNSFTFMPEEIVGNALLVPHQDHSIVKKDARLNLDEGNMRGYIKRKYKKELTNPLAFFDANWSFFTKKGIFIENNKIYPLETEQVGQGIRKIEQENQVEMLDQAIYRGSEFLIDQITETGKFIYGYFPAYGKVLRSYNSVRHYSSLYALLEAYEYLREQETISEEFLEKIEQGLNWGLMNLTQITDGNYYVAEWLKDGVELKLGAQAMVILALSKYQTVTGNKQFLPAMKKFLQGMKSFIEETGATTHVLDENLQKKEKFRIIYYDGEALFAIMRAYPLVLRNEWLELAELLMNHFIDADYQRYHDHWLSYSVNELTSYVPKRKYFEFGVKNALENLRFIERRDTAYPTMLELVVAAVKMFTRIEELDLGEPLFSSADFTWLKSVMEKRALHELRTGTMWPELAMFFAKPETIVGGFYCRHDRCRMRIDDAEHFLSGLINYRNFRDFKVEESRKIEALPNEDAFYTKEGEPLAISVIIPVYNREKEIAECLTKLAKTTFDKSRMEVLVADDASTDQTVQVIESFKNEFDHLKIIRLAENSGGASVPRNTAIEQAKGEWILFVDSDDFVTPDALADAFELAKQKETTDLVCMPYFRAEESRRAISRSAFPYPENINGLDFLETKLYNSLNVVGKMVRRSVIEKYQIEFPSEIRVREDNWFSMRLYGVVREIAFLGNQKDYYFIRDKDDVSLSNYGTPPRDAAKIFFTVFQFIFSLDELSSARKADIMAIYLNRYTKMIKRGKYSPGRVLEKTGQYLSLLKQSPYIDGESKQFIIDLYDAKYEVSE